MNYYLAIDIGASSGRHMLGWIEDGKLQLKEVYRFENYLIKEGEYLIWDMPHLVAEVKNGIKECAKLGMIPKTVAIDTWGVDYVLLDENKQEIWPCVSYRDSRTAAAVPEVEAIISAEDLYARTGIQKQNFNTIYQLWADKKAGRLDKAAYMMMIPCYLSYCLTGVIANEYTNATTGSLVNLETHEWDMELINMLGYPEHLFTTLKTPATELGGFTDEMKEFAGFDATVILCPSHDTASAVAACNVSENDMYISSGTWSLIGIETKEPIANAASQKANFANEGGIEYRYRFLKNYMGMWLIQNIRKNINKAKTYDELMEMAMACPEYYYIDVNADAFVAPDDMIEAIRTYLGKPDLSLDAVLNSVYHSLAKSYKSAVEEMENITGKTISAIRIIGGGCQDKYLNSLTEQYTGKKVSAGPIEATAAGNLLAQVLFAKERKDLAEARATIG